MLASRTWSIFTSEQQTQDKITIAVRLQTGRHDLLHDLEAQNFLNLMLDIAIFLHRGRQHGDWGPRLLRNVTQLAFHMLESVDIIIINTYS